MFSLLLECAEFTPGTLRACLEALTVIDALEIKRHGLPGLYESGIVYARQQGCSGRRDSDGRPTAVCKVPGAAGEESVYFREQWRSALIAYTERPMVGDCKVLACWRAAELRLAGERAVAYPMIKRFWNQSRTRWENLAHILVRRGDGRREDPSRILGMGKEDAT